FTQSSTSRVPSQGQPIGCGVQVIALWLLVLHPLITSVIFIVGIPLTQGFSGAGGVSAPAGPTCPGADLLPRSHQEPGRCPHLVPFYRGRLGHGRAYHHHTDLVSENKGMPLGFLKLFWYHSSGLPSNRKGVNRGEHRG